MAVTRVTLSAARDLIVVSHPGFLSDEQCARLRTSIVTNFPGMELDRVIVLEQGLTLTVVAKDDVA